MSSRKSGTFKPGIDVLEDRRLLAASISVVGNTLVIKGNNNNDTVVISDNGSGGAGNFAGSTLNGNTSGDLAGTVIQHVVVKLKDGNDSVVYNLGGDVTAPRDLTINFGGGKDSFTFNETIDDIETGGALAFYLNNSGGGNDTISITYSGELEGTLISAIQGGSGKESVTANYTFDSTSSGFFNANFNMGSGNDTVTLNVTNTAGSTAVVLALIDGDDDSDRFSATANVSVINFEGQLT